MTNLADKPTWEYEGDFFEELTEGDTFTPVTEKSIFDQRRWTTCYEQVFKRVSDDTFWDFSWESGSTEYQESSLNLYCSQVEPVEVTKVEYHTVKKEA